MITEKADEKAEKDMRLGKAAATIPSTKGDSTVHPTTVLKWIRRGVKLPDGTILKLDAVKRPGGWTVRESDIREFLKQYADAAAGAPVPARGPVVVASARRRRELDLVDERLEAHGLGLDPSDLSEDEEAGL
jgi:hypothetical protein